MIKKSLRAYITGGLAELGILLHCEVIRLAFRQLIKKQVYGRFEILIPLAALAGIEHIQQHRKILFFLRRFIVDIGDQRLEQQCRCLLPEIIAALFLALGVRHDDCDQRKYIGFTVQIMEGVIVHGSAEINGVQDLQLVMSFLDEDLSHFLHDRTFRVRAYIRCVHLQKVRLDMIAGLTGAGAAQHQYIQIHIPLFRVRDLPQCQALGVRQQDILCEIVIDERRNILLIAP